VLHLIFERAGSNMRPILKFKYNAKSFIENEMAPPYEYAGVKYPAQLISWFVGAPFYIDLSNSGFFDVVIPMNRGYQTGRDTRSPFVILSNENGILKEDTLFTNQMPSVTGARRAEIFKLANGKEAVITVAHDTGDGNDPELIFISQSDSKGRVLPQGIPALPSSERGKDNLANAHSLASGDVNGDGLSDILVGHWGAANASKNVGPFFLIQNKDSTFKAEESDFLNTLLNWPLVNPTPHPNILIDLHLADLNGNGYSDIIAGWGHGSASSHIFFNNLGNFTKDNKRVLPTSIYGINNQLHLKTFSGDFNNNGLIDLIILWSRFEPYYGGHYLQYLENDGIGNFIDKTDSAFATPYVEAYAERLGWSDYWQVGDFNNDGTLDIVGHTLPEQKKVKAKIYLNDGTGRFKEELYDLPSTALNGARPLVWGDFDKNGRLEFVTFETSWFDSTGTSSINLFNVYEFDRPIETVAIRSKSIDITGIPGQAYRVYKAAFNREPDQGGLGYWIAQMDSGMTLIEAAARFIDSNEFRAMYGTSPTDEQYLTKVYQNVLGRNPEPDGYNWWLNEIRTNPEKTRAKVLADFSESTENKAGTAQLVGQGIIYEPWVG